MVGGGLKRERELPEAGGAKVKREEAKSSEGGDYTYNHCNSY